MVETLRVVDHVGFFFCGCSGAPHPPDRYGMEKSNLTMAYQIDQVERTFPKRRVDDLPESAAKVLCEETLVAWWTGLSTMSGGRAEKQGRPIQGPCLHVKMTIRRLLVRPMT
jgi:hypothetical protein